MKKRMIIFYSILLSSFSLMAQSNLYSVDDLYNSSLGYSSSLKEKIARERAAGYLVKEARSKAAPTLSFESTMSYISNPDTLTVEAGQLGALGPTLLPVEDINFELTGNTYYDFKLILDQPVFTWGKIYNALQATKEGAAATSIDTQKMKALLKTEILINVSTLKHLKEIKEAVLKQREIATRLEYISKDSFENGMILQTEYLDAQSKSKEAELALNIISEQFNQILLNLTYLSGIELTEDMILTNISPISKLEPWQDISSESMMDNHDLSMLRHNIKAEEYKYKIQKGIYYFKPDLAFHAELSYSGSHFPFIQSGWDEKDKGNLTLTVGIKAPIADFGAMYSASKASEENLIAIRANYENSRDQIEKFIRQTTYEMELSELNINFYESRIDTDLQMMNQREKEWESGYGDEKDLLIQQINYYSNIILLSQEQIKLKTNFYKLENIRGNVNN